MPAKHGARQAIAGLSSKALRVRGRAGRPYRRFWRRPWFRPGSGSSSRSCAAFAQTLRNLVQRQLTTTLGTAGATHVRFLYGLPFGILFLDRGSRGDRRAPCRSPTLEAVAWTVAGRADPDRRDRPAAPGDAGTLVRRRDRLHQDRTGAGGPLRAGPARRSPDPRPRWRDPRCRPPASSLMSLPKDRTQRAASRPADAAWRGGGWALRPLRGRVSAAASTPCRGDNFIVNASTTLVIGLTIQTVVLTAYLWIADRKTLFALFAAWRPSLPGGFLGAFASQAWFLAFALESAARVRTLALVEIFFAQLLAGTAAQAARRPSANGSASLWSRPASSCCSTPRLRLAKPRLPIAPVRDYLLDNDHLRRRRSQNPPHLGRHPDPREPKALRACARPAG